MTRTFREAIKCPHCGREHTVETDFERWVRNHRQLDSVRESIVRFDLDVLLHKYQTKEVDGKGSRDIQFMMFVEVKTYMATPSRSQVDTLSILNQILRNRSPNIHSTPRRQVSRQVRRVHSKILGREVAIHLWGGHLLQMDGTSPESSTLMLWDNSPIDTDRLLELLRFVRNPDRPDLMIDTRRRSTAWGEAPTLFDLSGASE